VEIRRKDVNKGVRQLPRSSWNRVEIGLFSSAISSHKRALLKRVKSGGPHPAWADGTGGRRREKKRGG